MGSPGRSPQPRNATIQGPELEKDKGREEGLSEEVSTTALSVTFKMTYQGNPPPSLQAIIRLGNKKRALCLPFMLPAAFSLFIFCGVPIGALGVLDSDRHENTARQTISENHSEK